MRISDIKLFCLVMTVIVSCGVDRDSELETLQENIEKYDELRLLVETKYKKNLNSNRPRIVFLDCIESEKSVVDYICDDREILSRMEALNIKEIRFERKRCNNNFYSEVYFQKSKFNHYPIVYYLFERCGSGDFFESRNIFYQPVNDYWGLYIDSSFP